MKSLTFYQIAYIALVVIWAVFWPLIGVTYRESNEKRFASRDSARLPLLNRFLFAVVFLASGICLASPIWDVHPLWAINSSVLAVGMVLVLVLLGLAFHAGHLLGRRPMLSHGGRTPVFAGGPYAWVRHPTYVAITVAAWLTALMLGRLLALYAMFFLTSAHLALIFLEERATRQADPEAFAIYARHVPMLIPWRFGRAPFSEAPADSNPVTAEGLFAGAMPVLSGRAARAAAKRRRKVDGVKQGSGAGKKGNGKRAGKRKGRGNDKQGGGQAQTQAGQDAESRAWQLLRGKQD